MKKLLIMCGTGVATSTIVTNKVKEWLKEKGLTDQVKLYQSKVADEMNKIDNYDIVVSTTVVPDSIKDRVIMGLPLLTGIGTEEMYAEIEKENQRVRRMPYVGHNKRTIRTCRKTQLCITRSKFFRLN